MPIPRALPRWSQVRFSSSLSKLSPISKDSLYVISIPVTSNKSYIYCNHKPSSLLNKAQLQRISFVSKLESRVVGLASKGWHKLADSDRSINVKITNFVKRLLDTVPFEENCLKSFPSQKSMIREINEQSLPLVQLKLNLNTSNNLTQSDIENLKLPLDQIKPIPLYHAQFQQPSQILNQLYNLKEEGHAKHLKFATYCGVGIPLTLPFALVPVLPNVPGFYLTYRLYCNIKALLGVKHLGYLLEDRTGPADNSLDDTKHLTFKVIDSIDLAYASIDKPSSTETLVLTPEIIDRLCLQLDLDHIKEDLLKAVRQEKERLQKK